MKPKTVHIEVHDLKLFFQHMGIRPLANAVAYAVSVLRVCLLDPEEFEGGEGI